MHVDELPTPCLVIERRRLLRNLENMQEKADANGVRLRPHIKTHKSLIIGRRQLELGACGITVAKPGEAEVFVRGGFRDVRVAYPVIGTDKLARLLDMMDDSTISFCVDSLAGARAASSLFAEAGRTVHVLLKVDCGYGRVGAPWNDQEGVELFRVLTELPGLEPIGILTHAGHSYHGPMDGETPVRALRRVAAEERDRMLELARRLLEAGLIQAPANTAPDAHPFEISIGSTPSMAEFENVETDDGLRITEIRPGSYAFNDLTQVALRAARLTDCALTVLSTCVSRRNDEAGRRAVLDAGKKILTSDARHGGDGYGLLLDDPVEMTPLDGARLVTLSEEHGWVRLGGSSDLAVGDRVHVVPNHVCVAVNTQNQAYLVEGENVLQTLSVDARGRVR